MRVDAAHLIDDFAGLHAVVLGDAMLDRYSSGSCQRLCPEAPVPVVDVLTTRDLAGAAANSALNLRALGSRVTLVSTIGGDADGRFLRHLLQDQGVCVDHLLSTPARATLSKHRVLSGEHLLVRFDRGTTETLDSSMEQLQLRALDAALVSADLVLVADYGYGVLTPAIIDRLARWQAQARRTVVLDSKDLTRLACVGATAAKPNYCQVARLLGWSVQAAAEDRAQLLLPYGEEVLRRCGTRIAAVTLDADGALVFEAGKPPYRTFSRPALQTHAAGAGDTYLAAFALALATGAITPVAADLAAAAAAVVVGKEHTAVCSAHDLQHSLGLLACQDQQQLLAHLHRHRQSGRRIVLTNGCFDILHRGHVAYLNRAKTLGDILIVGVNSDESIRRLKGPSRPINSLEDRLEVLSGLGCIDHLVSFNESTPHRLIRAVRPDVFVKGGDYTRATLPEAALVEELGGKVVCLPYLAEHSTTGMIARIRDASLPTPLELHDAKEKSDHANRTLARRPQHSLR